jgi:hypothetical protein
MGAGKCLSLLMLTAILGKYPPRLPPGGPTGAPDDEGPGTADCPRCQEPSDAKSGSLFWCADCGIWFDSSGDIHNGAGS